MTGDQPGEAFVAPAEDLVRAFWRGAMVAAAPERGYGRSARDSSAAAVDLPAVTGRMAPAARRAASLMTRPSQLLAQVESIPARKARAWTEPDAVEVLLRCG